MNREETTVTRRIVLASLLGFVAGIAIEIIVVVVASIWSFVEDVDVTIPGIYLVRPAGPADLRGLDFQPSFGGLAVMLLAVVLIFVFGAVYLGARRSGQR
jgi:hypothetical protein